jgi:hypothetical protein
LLWSSPYIEPTPLTASDSYPHYVLAKPTGEVLVTGVGGPTPNPNSPSFNQMPIVQYSNTGVQNWVSTPNIYAGTGLATMFASDGSLFAIGSRNMYVFHYNPTPLANTQVTEGNLFSVAPNPFENTISIQLNDATLPTKATIIDITGKSLHTFDLNSENTTLDLSDLISGIYFCTFDSNNEIKTIKLVKK